LPYPVQSDSYRVKEVARRLPYIFKPLLDKRLPTLLYGGFKHGFVPLMYEPRDLILSHLTHIGNQQSEIISLLEKQAE